MQIWHLWTDSLTHLLSLIGDEFGLSQACAIICLTMLARVAMMPVSLNAALRMQRNRHKVEQIKPELEKLRDRYRDSPQELAKATMQLYRQHGIGFMDRLTLLNIGTQAGFGLGILQALRSMPLASPFLWIANIARPDFLLTLVVCVLMSAGMMLAPEMSAQSSSLVPMIVVSCIVTLITLSAMSSAVGIYWATSNVFSIGQSLILRAILQRSTRRLPGA